MAKDKNPLDPADASTPATTNGKTNPTSLAVTLTAPDGLSEFEKYRAFLRGDANKVWKYASLEWVDFCNPIIIFSQQNQ